MQLARGGHLSLRFFPLGFVLCRAAEAAKLQRYKLAKPVFANPSFTNTGNNDDDASHYCYFEYDPTFRDVLIDAKVAANTSTTVTGHASWASHSPPISSALYIDVKRMGLI